jgi:DNA-binding MarR family transcriptional regulator
MEKRKVNKPEKGIRLSANKLKPDYHTDHGIWVLMDRTQFAISRSRWLELRQFHLTKEQAQILYILRFYGGAANMTQIAAFSMRQRHSVSTLVDRMEKIGLLKKVKAPNKKGYMITVTKKATERYEKVTVKSIELLFSSLSVAEKQKLVELLLKLQTAARQMLGLDRSLPFLKNIED